MRAEPPRRSLPVFASAHMQPYSSLLRRGEHTYLSPLGSGRGRARFSLAVGPHRFVAVWTEGDSTRMIEMCRAHNNRKHFGAGRCGAVRCAGPLVLWSLAWNSNSNSNSVKRCITCTDGRRVGLKRPLTDGVLKIALLRVGCVCICFARGACRMLAHYNSIIADRACRFR